MNLLERHLVIQHKHALASIRHWWWPTEIEFVLSQCSTKCFLNKLVNETTGAIPLTFLLFIRNRVVGKQIVVSVSYARHQAWCTNVGWRSTTVK